MELWHLIVVVVLAAFIGCLYWFIYIVKNIIMANRRLKKERAELDAEIERFQADFNRKVSKIKI